MREWVLWKPGRRFQAEDTEARVEQLIQETAKEAFLSWAYQRSGRRMEDEVREVMEHHIFKATSWLSLWARGTVGGFWAEEWWGLTGCCVKVILMVTTRTRMIAVGRWKVVRFWICFEGRAVNGWMKSLKSGVIVSLHVWPWAWCNLMKGWEVLIWDQTSC